MSNAELEARLSNLENEILAYRMNYPPQVREHDLFDVSFLRQVDAGRILDSIRGLSAEVIEQLRNINELVAAKYTDNYIEKNIDELASSLEQLMRLWLEFDEICK